MLYLLHNTILLQVTNPQSMQAPAMLMMNLKGRVVPDAGGRETQIDCNLLYNVSCAGCYAAEAAVQHIMLCTCSGGK